MTSSSRRSKLFRPAGFASFTAAALMLTVACSSESDELFGFGAASDAGRAGSASSSSSGALSDADTAPDAPAPPSIRCGITSDGGMDDDDAAAATTDAGADAADDDDDEDAGTTSKECEEPPDDCIDSKWAARYSFGFCRTDQTCSFVVDVIRCEKGCFRQVDGGDKCNE